MLPPRSPASHPALPKRAIDCCICYEHTTAAHSLFPQKTATSMTDHAGGIRTKTIRSTACTTPPPDVRYPLGGRQASRFAWRDSSSLSNFRTSHRCKKSCLFRKPFPSFVACCMSPSMPSAVLYVSQSMEDFVTCGIERGVGRYKGVFLTPRLHPFGRVRHSTRSPCSYRNSRAAHGATIIANPSAAANNTPTLNPSALSPNTWVQV